MDAYTEQQRLSAPTLPVEQVLKVRRRADVWDLSISFLLLLLLVVTVTMVALGVSRAWAAPTTGMLPVAAPAARVVAVPVPAVPAEWAWESATHSGEVPGYTTAPRLSDTSIGEVNPESGQAMSGVIFR